MKPSACAMLVLLLAASAILPACTLGTGEYIHHPDPGIDQIECPPPARPRCGPR